MSASNTAHVPMDEPHLSRYGANAARALELEGAVRPGTVAREMRRALAEVERARDMRVRYIEVDRPVQMGDRIVFDYKGKADGKYFEGGEAQGATLDIGSGQFIPGFEDGMVGVEKEKAAE